jgi:hypothetical protein
MRFGICISNYNAKPPLNHYKPVKSSQPEVGPIPTLCNVEKFGQARFYKEA